MDIANNGEGGDTPNIAVKGAALLLVIGEPFSEDHKKLILGEVTKGGSFFFTNGDQYKKYWIKRSFNFTGLIYAEVIFFTFFNVKTKCHVYIEF